jgi:divalent metal cation (Fe/Co/Zn/Cd) transporter
VQYFNTNLFRVRKPTTTGRAKNVGEVRARWIGHRLHTEINVAVDTHSTVTEGHEIAKEVRHKLLHKIKHLGDVIVHIDPEDKAGEIFHRISEHSHDQFSSHSH